ncbi:MAG: 8-oxo-dGTP diphosphatase [Patescibacteria group bacterium]|jgi:8-oxo-dGTP diphosphatase|nr:8-oxo-dGTP diphosphatase [Patescibacteria group bacterium]MDQ5970030.1 8-oxo-dGTP diphosphatase [Patescibacteria group bacterium]
MKTIHDSATPTPGQQVITACAFIHREFDGVHKVFMAKRADTKKFLPGIYELPGGHIDYGEDTKDGLVREIQEEFGVEVRLGDPFAVFTYLNEVKGSHSIEVIYFAQLVDPDIGIKSNPEDHSTCGWFAESELPQTFVSEKDIEDDEVKAIYRGFTLLAGRGVDFGRVKLTGSDPH